MDPIKLPKSAKTAIRNASRKHIEDHFAALPRGFRRRKWINANNRYRTNCISRYRADIAPGGTVRNSQLLSYIAASAPCHAIDGWSFLGRAIDSALRRDAYGAIHFGYYAELRAAMALLACEGFCVLDDKHPVVSPLGIPTPLPQLQFLNKLGNYYPKDARTHVVPKPCLQHWSTLSKSADLLNEIVRPGDAGLRDWLGLVGVPSNSRAIGQKWLRAWGVDLGLMETDHLARNLVSYRPSEFRLPAAAKAEDVLSFVSELWQLFEPSQPRDSRAWKMSCCCEPFKRREFPFHP